MADIAGTVKANPNGGQDINVQAMKSFGDEKVNAAVGVFAAGNDSKGPVTTGAFGALNANGHGVSIQHSNTPGVGNNLSENLRLNVLKTDQHALDVNAFHGRTQLQNGLKFDNVGANTSWNSAQGHSASVGVNHIPKFNMTTVNAAANANLWTSSNQASSLNLNANASRHVAGPFRGKNDFGAGLGFTHRF
ncbi:attacin-A-like [Lucilia sericata]|uniref:attacin-A-like n=1 Tax=Lucilia sericata TaxID=13632 RepID=UPI0018A80B3A|nr:attacin-A-like [Lucilia sericata]